MHHHSRRLATPLTAGKGRSRTVEDKTRILITAAPQPRRRRRPLGKVVRHCSTARAFGWLHPRSASAAAASGCTSNPCSDMSGRAAAHAARRRAMRFRGPTGSPGSCAERGYGSNGREPGIGAAARLPAGPTGRPSDPSYAWSAPKVRVVAANTRPVSASATMGQHMDIECGSAGDDHRLTGNSGPEELRNGRAPVSTQVDGGLRDHGSRCVAVRTDEPAA